MTPQYVPEIEVLIKVARLLNSEGWQIEKVCLPQGDGIDYSANKKRLQEEFSICGIATGTIRFGRTGEDIKAKQKDGVWRIECKGTSLSTTYQTNRNNFDRAVASVVSYYDGTERLRLGLAIPEELGKLLHARLPQALREAIDLWVFIYSKADNEVFLFAPEEEIPYSE